MTIKKQYEHQAVFVQAPYVYTALNFFFLVGGYGCGKTSALVDSVLRAIKAFAGKKDLEGRTPKIGVCGITLTFLKKTFAGSLIQVFDATKTRYNYDKANNIIYVAGVELHLTAIIEEKDIFGYDWCCAFVDELDELETYKAINVVRAINERTRQVIPGARPAFISFATTSQGLKGTYQVVKSFERDGIGYFLIRGETKANTALDKKKVADMYKLYSEKEVECLLEGKFVSIDSGKPYPDYDPVKCKMRSDLFDSVEENETIYIGQDFNSGFNKAVALIIREGIIFAIKEYSFPDLRSAPKVMRYDFPKNLIKWIPDATGSEKVMLFKKELRANGIKVMMRSRNPPIQDRTFLVNKLFYSGRMFVCPFCKDLDNALVIRQNDPKTGLPMKGKTESAPDHLCFAGETKIATNKGLVRIDNIKIGDMILTRNGYKKCTASMKTGHKEVHKYRIGDKTICCTEDHPIFTVDSGMLPAKDLTRSSMCVTLNTWHTESLAYSMESSIEDIRAQKTGPTAYTIPVVAQIKRKGTRICTETFINNTKEEYRKDFTFTIVTVIQKITTRLTLSLYLEKNTVENMAMHMRTIVKRNCLKILLRLERKLLLGIEAKKEERGIESNVNITSERKKKEDFLRAKNVALNTKESLPDQSIAQISAYQKQEEKELTTTKQGRATVVNNSLSTNIVSASSAPESVRVGMMDVYNITVEGDHEYFADGVLVSNCDALEYAITYMVLWLRELKDIYTVTLGRRIEKRIEAGLSNAEDENYVDDGLGVA